MAPEMHTVFDSSFWCVLRSLFLK